MTTDRKEFYTLELRAWKHAVLIKYTWINAFYRESTHYLEVAADVDSSYVQPFKYRLTYRVLSNPNDPLARWVSRDYAIRDTGEDAVNAAEEKIKHLLTKTIPAELRRGKRTKAYKALEREIKDNPELLQHYKTDFTHHDALNLARHNPTCFVWILREGGTHLLISNCEWATTTIDYHARNPRAQYYIYDYRGLHRVQPENAREYVRKYLPKDLPEPKLKL